MNPFGGTVVGSGGVTTPRSSIYMPERPDFERRDGTTGDDVAKLFQDEAGTFRNISRLPFLLY